MGGSIERGKSVKRRWKNNEGSISFVLQRKIIAKGNRSESPWSFRSSHYQRARRHGCFGLHNKRLRSSRCLERRLWSFDPRSRGNRQWLSIRIFRSIVPGHRRNFKLRGWSTKRTFVAKIKWVQTININNYLISSL